MRELHVHEGVQARAQRAGQVDREPCGAVAERLVCHRIACGNAVDEDLHADRPVRRRQVGCPSAENMAIARLDDCLDRVRQGPGALGEPAQRRRGCANGQAFRHHEAGFVDRQGDQIQPVGGLDLQDLPLVDEAVEQLYPFVPGDLGVRHDEQVAPRRSRADGAGPYHDWKLCGARLKVRAGE